MDQPAPRVSLIGKTAQACEYVSLACLAVIATLIFVQILLRNFASLAYAGIEEMARFAHIILVFLLVMPADKIEQRQHGLVGAGAVYPQGSTWTVDGGTKTSATVTEPGTGGPWVFRDFSIIAQKSVVYYADSFPVHNLEGAEGSFGVTEDSQDMGGMTINYGTEPMWFRFGVNPNAHGALSQVKAGDAYSNNLVGGDPQTALFTAMAGNPFRMHVLMPTGPGRGSTFDLHGHVWQRDPYVCNSADPRPEGEV